MNRIEALFRQKPGNILSVYFTAGYPGLDDTLVLLQALQDSGVDMVELGIPFSDPLADGPTIQRSGEIALKNGMSLKVLFEQIKDMRRTIHIPVLLMGYLNPVMQYGIRSFVEKCSECGIDGVIIPDLPLEEYVQKHKPLFREKDIRPVFLVTPQTSGERIRTIDRESNGFIYMVSSSSVTGNSLSFNGQQSSYFERVKNMKLSNPTLVGFGISDRKSFDFASSWSRGAIVGSAFIKHISGSRDLKAATKEFIDMLRTQEL